MLVGTHLAGPSLEMNRLRVVTILGSLAAACSLHFDDDATSSTASTSSGGASKKPSWCRERPGQAHETFKAVWGTDSGAIWALGRNEVLAWNGAAWADQFFDDERIFTRLRGSSAMEIWAAGRDEGVPALLRWNGTKWSEDFSARFAGTMTDVWSGDGEAWAVAEGYPIKYEKNGAVFHRESGSWKLLATTANPLRSVWGSDSRNVWAVGEGGEVQLWNGTALQRVEVPTHATLHRVWGTGPKDVWAVGDSGVIVRWDGESWKRVSSGVTSPLEDVVGRGPSNVWIVGGNGVVIQWNGEKMARVRIDRGSFAACDGMEGRRAVPLDFVSAWVGASLASPRLVTADGQLLRPVL
jgi:hypothetical protein